MSVFGNLASTIGGAATGGVLGTLGSLGTLAATYYVDKQKAKDEREAKALDYSHELALLEKNQQGAAAQALSEMEKAKIDATVQEKMKSYEGLLATVADQTALSNRASQWVVDFMTFVRPGLTLVLLLGGILFGIINNENAFYQFSMMASMAVAWWFGDRQQSQNRWSK